MDAASKTPLTSHRNTDPLTQLNRQISDLDQEITGIGTRLLLPSGGEDVNGLTDSLKALHTKKLELETLRADLSAPRHMEEDNEEMNDVVLPSVVLPSMEEDRMMIEEDPYEDLSLSDAEEKDFVMSGDDEPAVTAVKADDVSRVVLRSEIPVREKKKGMAQVRDKVANLIPDLINDMKNIVNTAKTEGIKAGWEAAKRDIGRGIDNIAISIETLVPKPKGRTKQEVKKPGKALPSAKPPIKNTLSSVTFRKMLTECFEPKSWGGAEGGFSGAYAFLPSGDTEIPETRIGTFRKLLQEAGIKEEIPDDYTFPNEDFGRYISLFGERPKA